jgi:ACS family hexuronate transporter-like MFS transporter
MIPSPSPSSPPLRGPAWQWWVCGLLLLATMLNYMDRITLSLTAVRILFEFHLDERHYGQLESGFAFGFALGAIVVGWMADRWNVRWIYPAAVLVWSAAGLVTGLAQGFVGLLLCRFILGLAEAGNWPCALRTTQHILPPAQRTLGNSLLQSGAALGAILTPLGVLLLVAPVDARRSPESVAAAVGQTAGASQSGGGAGTVAGAWLVSFPVAGAWRPLFMAIGGLGIFWVLLWLLSTRRSDLAQPQRDRGASLLPVLGWLSALLALDVAARIAAGEADRLPGGLSNLVGSTGFSLAVKCLVCVLGISGVIWWLLRATQGEGQLPRGLFLRRFVVLMVLVVSINVAWHYFRAWLPLFLQKQHGYSETDTSRFMLVYYVATDLGSLTAGFVTLALIRWNGLVHGSRVAVFVVCAVLTALSVVVAQLPAGPLLLGTLLVIGFAALGLFPVYYSFSQEITVQHQGKLTGALGCINWLAMYLLHELAGESIKQTRSYSQGVALAGLAPLLGVAALLFWGAGRGARPAPAK